MSPRISIPIVVLGVVLSAWLLRAGTPAGCPSDLDGTEATGEVSGSTVPADGPGASGEGVQLQSGPDELELGERLDSANPEGPATPVGGTEVAPPAPGSETVSPDSAPAGFEEANPPGPGVDSTGTAAGNAASLYRGSPVRIFLRGLFAGFPDDPCAP